MGRLVSDFEEIGSFGVKGRGRARRVCEVFFELEKSSPKEITFEREIYEFLFI